MSIYDYILLSAIAVGLTAAVVNICRRKAKGKNICCDCCEGCRQGCNKK